MLVTIPAGDEGVIIPDLAAGTYLVSISAPGYVTATGTVTLTEGQSASYGYSLGFNDPRQSYHDYALAYFHALAAILGYGNYVGITMPALFIEQVTDIYERLVDGETIGEATAHEMIDLVNEGWTYIEPYVDNFTGALGDFVDTMAEEGTEAVLKELGLSGDDDEEGGSSKLFLILALAGVVILATEVL